MNTRKFKIKPEKLHELLDDIDDKIGKTEDLLIRAKAKIREPSLWSRYEKHCDFPKYFTHDVERTYRRHVLAFSEAYRYVIRLYAELARLQEERVGVLKTLTKMRVFNIPEEVFHEMFKEFVTKDNTAEDDE